MSSISKPTCYVIAGPNGAGKTTFALRYLPEMTGCRNFINADLIADGLSPLNPAGVQLEAGKILLREIKAHVESGGHDIPVEAIIRRYRRTVSNFLTVFAPLCDEVFCYDNSNSEPVPVFSKVGHDKEILDSERYRLILESCDG
ncbi:MAG: hypothetical protein IT583_06825 [Verrucomicrobia bacterium]|nr:hypothetical protein [Verrucomicrobiota bacterium]